MIADKGRIFKILAILAGVLGSLYVLSPFLSAILLAAVIAFAIEPLVKRIRNARWFGHSSCVYVLIVSLFLLITVPFLTVIYKVYSFIHSLDLMGEGKKNAMESFNLYKSQLLDFLNSTLGQFGLRKTFNVETMVNDTTQRIFGSVLQISTYAVTQIPDILFSFAVFMVTLFLFMRHSSWIGRSFYSSRLMNQSEGRQIVKVLKKTSYSSVFSSLVTGFIQSTLVSGGAAFLMEVDVALVFIVTFLCSFIPVIGAAPIAFVLALIAWAKGEPGAAIGMVTIACIAGVADNIIRVWLMKGVKKAELHPFVDLLAVIGGVIVLGLPGLFLGPVIVSATAQMVPILLGEEDSVETLKPSKFTS